MNEAEWVKLIKHLILIIFGCFAVGLTERRRGRQSSVRVTLRIPVSYIGECKQNKDICDHCSEQKALETGSCAQAHHLTDVEWGPLRPTHGHDEGRVGPMQLPNTHVTSLGRANLLTFFLQIVVQRLPMKNWRYHLPKAIFICKQKCVFVVWNPSLNENLMLESILKVLKKIHKDGLHTNPNKQLKTLKQSNSSENQKK